MRADALKKETLKEKNGQVLDMRLRVDDIDPVYDELYAPGAALQSPSISVVWRAERIPWGRTGFVWIEHRDWNMIAAQIAAVERHYLQGQKDVAALAHDLAAPADSVAVPERLFAYVRDELQLVLSEVYDRRDETQTVDDVLKARAGSVYEKSYVLLARLRSLEVPAEVVWVHDPEEGGFFPDYPKLGAGHEPPRQGDVAGS